MRVTNSMLTNNALYNINRNLTTLMELQLQEASGKKIQRPSDDPIVASRSLKYRNYVHDVEQYQKNADDAISWMDFCDSSLDDLCNSITELKDKTIQAANDPLTEDDLEAVKEMVEVLKQNIMDIGNTRYSDRYVFAGFDTDKPPFEVVSTSVGDKVAYKGKYLYPGEAVSANIPDSEIEDFYRNSFDEVSGQPELIMANFTDFTAMAPQLDFTITLDGVTQTVNLTDGMNYDINSMITELQSQINSKFPPGSGEPDPLIKVSEEKGRLKLTVQKGDSIKINSGSLDVSKLGFKNGVKSVMDERQDIYYGVGSRNRIDVNAEGDEIFGKGEDNLFSNIQKLELALSGETSYKTARTEEGPPFQVIVETHELDISSIIGDFEKDLGRVLNVRAEIGAKYSYAELVKNRLMDDYTNFTELQSNNEDVDMAEITTKLSCAEYVYQASISTAAKIMQMSLLDFLR